jgi:hypothetical protein
VIRVLRHGQRLSTITLLRVPNRAGLFARDNRRSRMLAALPGIATNLLAERLRQLQMRASSGP